MTDVAAISNSVDQTGNVTVIWGCAEAGRLKKVRGRH
jgi:hypothetical protein